MRICKYCKSDILPVGDMWKRPMMDYYGNYWTCAFRSERVNEPSKHE